MTHFLIFQRGRFPYEINQTLLIFNQLLTNIILRGRKIRTPPVRFYLFCWLAILICHKPRTAVRRHGQSRGQWGGRGAVHTVSEGRH